MLNQDPVGATESGIHWQNSGVVVDEAAEFKEALSHPSHSMQDITSERSVESEADSEETIILEDQGLVELSDTVLAPILRQPNLLKLSLKGNRLATVPPPLSSLANLYYLNLSHNAFREVPLVVCSLPGLEILDLSSNNLASLPDEISQLQNLMVLSMVANNIEVLPPQIADLKKLVILELDDNPIRVPNALPVLENEDEEAWLVKIRDYIVHHRTDLQRAVAAQRNGPVAASDSAESVHPAQTRVPSVQQLEESGDALRAAKRMGFVMHRNAPGSSYVASLHARGLSHDAHMLDTASTGSLSSDDLEKVTAGGQHGHSMSSFAIPDVTSGLMEPSQSRSPLPRSPRESPWSSPRTSINDIGEPQSSTGSRLSTLAEERERADSDDEALPVLTPGTDATAETIVDKRTGSASSADYIDGSNTLFKESYLTEATKASMDATFEKITYALSQVAKSVVPLASLLPPDVVTQFTGAFTQAEQGSYVGALKACTTAMERLTAPLVFRSFVSRMERRDMRNLVSTLMAVFPELEAAWRAVQMTRSPPPSALESANLSNSAAGVDAQLHTQLEYATKQAQSVLALLNEAIARSAQDAAHSSEPATAMASRVRGLSESSLSCAAAARSVNDLLDRSSSARSRALSLTERRRLWDEVNLFLKSIISMLGAVKEALGVIPLLAASRIGPEVSNLAKVAKEIPPLLEQSSYKVLLDGEHQPGDVPPGNNLVMLAPPTPLTAAIGAAAQALISPSIQGQTPFFEEPAHTPHLARR